MKKALLISTIALALTSSAFAEDPVPANAMPITKIITMLQDQGFCGVNEVEYDDGVYKAKVFAKTGHEYELKINPQTGKMINKPVMATSSMLDAIKGATQAGFTNISEIEADDSGYKIKAYKGQQKYKIRVNGQTGKVMSMKEDH